MSVIDLEMLCDPDDLTSRHETAWTQHRDGVDVRDHLQPWISSFFEAAQGGQFADIDHSVRHRHAEIVNTFAASWLPHIRRGDPEQRGLQEALLALINAARDGCSCISSMHYLRGCLYHATDQPVLARRDLQWVVDRELADHESAAALLESLPRTAFGPRMPFSIIETNTLSKLGDPSVSAARVWNNNGDGWKSGFVVGQSRDDWFVLTAQHSNVGESYEIELLAGEPCRDRSFSPLESARTATPVWCEPKHDLLVVQLPKSQTDGEVAAVRFGQSKWRHLSEESAIVSIAAYCVDFERGILRINDPRVGRVKRLVRMESGSYGNPGDGFAFDWDWVVDTDIVLGPGACGGLFLDRSTGACVGMHTGKTGFGYAVPSEVIVRELKSVSIS